MDKLIPILVGRRTEIICVFAALANLAIIVKPDLRPVVETINAVLAPLGFAFFAAKVGR